MKERTVLRHSISGLLALCAGLLLLAGNVQARPDPVTFGIQVELGNRAQVREWLDQGLDPNFIGDRIGTGLMIAAWYGDIPMMELFVARGADVNFPNQLNERAVMHAAYKGQGEAVKWLLARGARINNGTLQWSALHYAVFAGHGAVAALLLERGADINAQSTNGSSVLMMAVHEDHEDLVRQLLAKGADPRIKNERGEGALEWAFMFKRLAIARLVGTPQQFVAAASRPAEQWGRTTRSVPAPPGGPSFAPSEPDPLGEKIAELVKMRELLAQRGMRRAVDRLDTRIASLRAQRARADKDSLPRAVLEISAKRASPAEQRTRLIFQEDGPPP
jgi:hypothetical protein